MTTFKEPDDHTPRRATRRIAEVIIEPGVPGTPWERDRIFAVFTDGSQDLVLTTAPDEVVPARTLLGLTRAQVAHRFGTPQWPN